MLSFIIVIWILYRLFRPRWGYRRYYRPFLGWGWGLPLLGLFLSRRDWRRPPYGHGPYGGYGPHDGPDAFRGRGPDGFGGPGGPGGFGGPGGW